MRGGVGWSEGVKVGDEREGREDGIRGGAVTCLLPVVGVRLHMQCAVLRPTGAGGRTDGRIWARAVDPTRLMQQAGPQADAHAHVLVPRPPLPPAAQVVPRLVGSLPVVIDAGNWEEPAEALDDVFLGDAEIWWVGGRLGRLGGLLGGT